MFLEKLILGNEILSEKELKDLEKTVRKEIDEAVEECKKAPRPSLDRLTDHIYVEKTEVRGCL